MKAKTEAELGVMRSQAKETKKSDNHQKLEETRKDSPLRASRDLDFALLASRNVRL